MEYSSICVVRSVEIDGIKGKDLFIPHLLGHEGVGKVMRVGEGVKTVSEGDLVILHWKVGEGLQSENPEYFYKRKKINAGPITTFSEMTIVSENRVSKIHTKLNKKILPLLGCCIPTAFGAVENNAKLKLFEKVIIFGAGGVGINIIIAAKKLNCEIFWFVDINQAKLNWISKKFKCNVFNLRQKNIKKTDLLDQSNTFDVCFETTGNTQNIELGYKLVKKTSGRTVLLGVPKINNHINIFSLDMHFGKKLVGSHGGNYNPQLDLNRYLKFMESDSKDFYCQVDEVINLNEINKGIEKIRLNKTHGKIIINLKKSN